MPQFQGRLTYGKIGEWRFDKRSFDRVAPPRNLPLPPPGVPQSVVCFNMYCSIAHTQSKNGISLQM